MLVQWWMVIHAGCDIPNDYHSAILFVVCASFCWILGACTSHYHANGRFSAIISRANIWTAAGCCYNLPMWRKHKGRHIIQYYCYVKVLGTSVMCCEFLMHRLSSFDYISSSFSVVGVKAGGKFRQTNGCNYDALNFVDVSSRITTDGNNDHISYNYLEPQQSLWIVNLSAKAVIIFIMVF